MADPLQFSDLYDTAGVGLICRDAVSGSAANRKRVVNDAYVELASTKGYWRLRTTTITLTANTYQYNLPSDFSDIFRIYYRNVGFYREIRVVPDSWWLEMSRTQASDSGIPIYARVTQTSATQQQVELSPPSSSSFISTNPTLSLEYFINVARLVNDTDVPILPPDVRHLIVDVASYRYALSQSDWNLATQLKARAVEARNTVFKMDLTRTGRVRQARPQSGYRYGDAIASYHPYGSHVGIDYL